MKPNFAITDSFNARNRTTDFIIKVVNFPSINTVGHYAYSSMQWVGEGATAIFKVKIKTK